MAAASLALGVRFTAGAAGSSAFTDAGAVAGYRGTSALTVGKTYRYRAENAALTEWEWGTGVWNGTNLTRVLSFSSTGGVVSFAAAPQVAITIEPGDVLSFTDAMSLTDVEKAQGRANIGVLGRNPIVNGQFIINQRAAASTADNAYGIDRWRSVGEFATANIYADSFDAAGGSVPGGGFQFTGTTDKGGWFQVIEGRNCKYFRSKTVTLSALMVVSNLRLGNIKMGILEWTGTEDATTGDPVASWGADGVTPTLATNWAFKNTPANLSVTTAPAAYSVTATLGSTFTNLAVLIWNDDKSYNANDFFNVSNVQLGEGGVAMPYDQKMHSTLIAECLRYFRIFPTWFGGWYNTTSIQIAGNFDPVMRGTPTLTLISGTAAASQLGVSNPNVTAIAGVSIGATGGYINLTTSAATSGALGFYQGNVGVIHCNAEI